MIDHLSITTTDLDRAQAFYDAALCALGYPRVHAPPYISIYLCTDKLVPDNRHWCFRAKSRAAVRAFHQAALAHGGSDDGPPGIRERYSPDYYAAFVRDPDGNRIEAVTRRPEE
jgi:catechol 2,3-dioxygenase-like lactoylglutathione lyase family enzyme